MNIVKYRFLSFALIFILMFWSLPDTSTGKEGPIRIASIFSFTGMASGMNRNSIEGVRMGVREINESGGLLGRQVELVEIDNLSTPIGSKVAADRAVRENVSNFSISSGSNKKILDKPFQVNYKHNA